MDEIKSKFAPTSCQEIEYMEDYNEWEVDVVMQHAWEFKSMGVLLPWHSIQGSYGEVGCCLPRKTSDSSAFFLSKSTSNQTTSFLRPYRKNVCWGTERKR